jgi:formylglycine-generating enzyme required for sulfatase activity
LLPDRIEYAMKNGDKAVFLLIEPTGGLKPYYLMETKVPNNFFAEFASADPDAVAATDWRNDAPARQPAMRVTAAEAFQFAHWLGGNLPTVKQWDYAARLSSWAGLKGPSRKAGDVAVGRSEPRALDDPVQDVGPHGFRDLSGNGREWTRDILGSAQSGPLDKPTAADLVILRGRNFTLSKPLTYADLDYEATVPQTQYYLKASPYTTFRVVIEVGE